MELSCSFDNYKVKREVGEGEKSPQKLLRDFK